MLQLPPLSKHIRILTQEESLRLDEKYPTTLPKSLKDCVTCRGRRQFRWWVDYGTSQEIDTYQCPCVDQFILHKYLLNAGLGTALQRYSVGDLTDVPTDVMNAVTDYVMDHDFYVGQGKGFIFQGDRGTGKTLIASLMLKMLLDTGVDGYFTTFNDLLNNFTAGWKDDKQAAWFESRVRNAPLLVVDDIGKEYEKRVGISSVAIDNIFRSRVNDALPTIITTNLSSQEMSSRYSTALETLASMSKTYVFVGPTWRLSEKEADRYRKELDNKLTRPIVIY